jgi:SAM-dependent methyltransferase
MEVLALRSLQSPADSAGRPAGFLDRAFCLAIGCAVLERVKTALRRRWTNGVLAVMRIASVRANRRCAICNRDVFRFFDGRCPHCGSLSRHRLIAYTYAQAPPSSIGGTVVHLGAIPIERRWVQSHVRPAVYHRVDILPTAEATLVADATSLPLPDASADLAIAWHVLEHIPSDRAAIKELFRVLRPGGQFLVSVPLYPKGQLTTFEDASTPPEDRERVYGFHEHVRGCGMDYRDRLVEAGFEVTTVAIAERPPAERAHFGLSDGHVAWICRKS